MPWNEGLAAGSPAHAIATSEHTRIRVLAGPGTGKSFAMKRRVARLLERDEVPPGDILAVTFTRVAAEDLHRELLSLAVANAEGLVGRTLHSLAMSILLRNHVLQTLGRMPRPLNEFELEPLLADLSNAHGNKRERRKLIDAYVAGWARLQHEEPGYAQTPADQAFADELLEWLVLHEAMLIGEVIPQLYEYLRVNPGAPERAEFSHLLIDEYQDLNRVEQQVLALLGTNSAICVIGDDDQSIYRFKHAHPIGIRQWTQVNNGEDHQITECHRCPTTVVRMANALITRNQNRMPRAMIERPGNGPGIVAIRQYPSADAEADAVAAKITALVQAGTAPGEIIVLAQREKLATPIFTRLRNADVPVKSYYAESELDSIYAQERFAMLKLYLNNEDRVALRWLLGCNHNSWHSAAYARVLNHVRDHGVSPWVTMTQLQAGTLRIPYTNALITRFAEITAELVLLAAAADLDGFVQTWLPPGHHAVLLAERTDLCRLQCDTIEQLFDSLYAAITQPEIPLQVDEVRIMSLHKSKGLSSPYVFIVGCVEGLIPGQPELGTPVAVVQANLEEDRRLFYVGITRVKADPGSGRPGYLAITYSQTMASADAFASQIRPVSVGYGVARLQASRFIQQLGPSAPVPQNNTPL
jgi:DNA helicase II / ATP-dependent DNA helicase PcrA